MDSHFWFVLEKKLGYSDIPDFIKYGITMCGFANALSFKDMDDEHIEYVETFIRENVDDFAVKSLRDVNECETSMDNYKNIDIFGRTFANRDAKFKFMLGDKMVIKSLVTHVKNIVDGNGPLEGLSFFEPPKKNKKAVKSVFDSITRKKKTKKTKGNSGAMKLTQNELNILETDLCNKIENCLMLYNVDVTNWNHDLISIDQTGTYGIIQCALCPLNNEGENENEKKKNPVRVYYSHSKQRSSYWVLSNFTKHLENKHQLVSNRSNEIKTKTAQKKIKSQLEVKTEEVKTDEVPIEEMSVVLVHVDESHSDVNINNSSEELFDQLSAQISKMYGVVLTNGEQLDVMEIQLKKSACKNISVVKTDTDGNCLFSALAHQLFGNTINSREHKNEIKMLRSSVVEHILLPENFPRYEYALQDRVLESKNETEIEDFTTECKLYVRLVLSRPNIWGGTETIAAVSNLYEVNIIVFNENGTCYMFKGSEKKNNQTIAIAYRLGCNEQGNLIYNHYDSVCDMDSECVFASTDFIINK